MMIDPIVHLTDEELIAVRDGECEDMRLIDHVHKCGYCRAVLKEWSRFARRVKVSVPSEPSAKAPRSSRAVQRQELLQREIKEPHLSFLLNKSDSDRVVVRAKMSHEPEAPPDSWIKSAQRSLAEVPDRRSLGSLTLSATGDSGFSLAADAATGIARREATYNLDDSLLNLTVRQAGFTTLLVARLEGRWRKGGAGEYDMTLVSASGRIRTRSLEREYRTEPGMAWFPVPAGESTLLIHLEDTWELRLRKVSPDINGL